MNGRGAIGAETLNGATVNVGTTATPAFNNTDQIAYHAAGVGSTINSSSSATSNVTTARPALYRIDDAAALNSAQRQILLSVGQAAVERSHPAPTACLTTAAASSTLMATGQMR